MICLRTFPTKEALLAVLESAGLAKNGNHDASCVDVFEIWPQSAPHGWTANIALDEADIPGGYLIPTPAYPQRTFA